MESIVSDFKDVVVSDHSSFGETLKKMNHHNKSITLVADKCFILCFFYNS